MRGERGVPVWPGGVEGSHEEGRTGAENGGDDGCVDYRDAVDEEGGGEIESGTEEHAWQELEGGAEGGGFLDVLVEEAAVELHGLHAGEGEEDHDADAAEGEALPEGVGD